VEVTVRFPGRFLALLLAAGVWFIHAAAAAQDARWQSLPCIDLGACGLSIEEIEIVDRLKTERGTIKPHDRGLRIVVVRLRGTAPASGVLACHPQIFSLVSRTDDDLACRPSKGVALRITDRSGELRDVWLIAKRNEQSTFEQDLVAGEAFTLLAAFDLAEDADAFHVLAPTPIAD
jgi:hypothetical protein